MICQAGKWGIIKIIGGRNQVIWIDFYILKITLSVFEILHLILCLVDEYQSVS